MEDEIQNEILINGNNLIPMNNILKLCKSTVRIILPNKGEGSGFFIKFLRNKKDYHCLMTNEHIISEELIEQKSEIAIYYNNLKEVFIFKLDKQERIIIFFKETLNIDLTVIEILEKDNINEEFFLDPSYQYIDGYQKFFGKEIEITQYPGGKELSWSRGTILEINSRNNENLFSHNASTQSGSSGSPIVLKGEEKVLGIHKGGNEKNNKNFGFFIWPAIEIIKEYKKTGFGIEYYKNGTLKYEGNFVDDEYEGDGKFYYGSGIFYFGEFKKGTMNGVGIVYDSNEEKIIKDGVFSNNEFIFERKPDDQEDIINNNFYDNNNISNNSDNEYNNNSEDEKNNDDNIDDNNESENNSNNNNKNNNNDNNNIYSHNKIKVDNNDIIYNNINKNNINNNNFNDDINKNNINNNNNFNNNNNIKNKNDGINFVKILQGAKAQLYHTFEGVGKILNFYCRACKHSVKRHSEIEFGHWECKQCNSICHCIE